MQPDMKNPGGGISPVIALDRRAREPLHRQIYDAYRKAILEGKLQPGQQVPSTRSLCAELDVSRIPILDAYSQLLAEGYFETRAGAGTFVSSSLSGQLASSSVKIAERTDSGPRMFSQRSGSIPSRDSVPWATGPGAFSLGHLAFDHFPFQTWATLVARHARRVRASALNYSDPMGSGELRESIATYLRTARAVRCEARQIMIVSGSQQALDLCARVLLDPGTPVWIEDPGYALMRYALAISGCQLVPVPVDREGIDVAAGIKRCRKARAAYVTPSHQFPLGVTMTVSRRLQILDWAHSQGSWIIEDDYDSEYRYESMPIASLQGLDRGSRVIYIGTFSKTLFPSLRVGYMVLPIDLVDRFAAVRRATDICPPHLFHAVLAELIDRGHYARHVRKTRMLYNERRKALVHALRCTFESLEILGAESGMHLVVTLPPPLPDQKIAFDAAKEKLWLWPLSTAYAGKEVRQGFILGFGSVREAEMAGAVRRLHELLTD